MTALAHQLADLKPGFRDPTRESQTLFRALMEAMAHPGQIVSLSSAPEPPEGLSRACGAIALTLADQDAPLWAPESLQLSPVGAWLRFHTGASFVSHVGDAHFAFLPSRTSRPALREFHQGDPKYPDRAATVIVELTSLEGGPALHLEGPGIQATRAITPHGLDRDFWSERADLVGKFQLGIDLFLTAGDHALALPRTTRVQF